MDNQLALVQATKSQLEARDISLQGACGAFAITKRVAWALRSLGAGLLAKSGGNNCNGFATDIVMFGDGSLVDILGDGGGANTPMWDVTGEVRPLDQFRAPTDPGDEVVFPPGPPFPSQPFDPPAPSLTPLDVIVEQLAGIHQKLDALKLQADANTEKIQTQIHDVVKAAEKSATAALPLLGGIFGKHV